VQHEAPAPGTIDPEDSFLVQLRGGSRLADRDVSGRIEHLHSGISEPFGSLAELFAFLGRYFGRSGDGATAASEYTPGFAPGDAGQHAENGAHDTAADAAAHQLAAHPANGSNKLG
jgi:hypothetical protein